MLTGLMSHQPDISDYLVFKNDYDIIFYDYFRRGTV